MRDDLVTVKTFQGASKILALEASLKQRAEDDDIQIVSQPGPAKRRRSSTTSPRPSELEKKLKICDTVDLESYFYATLPGDAEVLYSEFKADMAFKCPECKLNMNNNIDFMDHLTLHAHGPVSAVDLLDSVHCIFCFTMFDSANLLEMHVKGVHLGPEKSFRCKICGHVTKASHLLIKHMATKHLKSEMPYKCHICGYRSSIHTDSVQHFREAHDRTDKLQCPTCLKTFALLGNVEYDNQTAVKFIEHVALHVEQANARPKQCLPCQECQLQFVSVTEMRRHQKQDHGSFMNFPEVIGYNCEPDKAPIKMPKPDESKMRIASRSQAMVSKCQQKAFAAQNLDDLALYDVDQDSTCHECGQSFCSLNHFNAYLCCTSCRYSSCCSKAMSKHVNIFHGTKQKPEFDLGAPIILDKSLFCGCGYSSTSGNKLAKHMANHRCFTAFKDKASASQCKWAPPALDNESDESNGATSEVLERLQTEGPLALLELSTESPRPSVPEEQHDDATGTSSDPSTITLD